MKALEITESEKGGWGERVRQASWGETGILFVILFVRGKMSGFDKLLVPVGYSSIKISKRERQKKG